MFSYHSLYYFNYLLLQSQKIQLNMNKGNNLNCFFPEAVTYPVFFNTNLTDANRVLKITTGNEAWARAFYYQLLKAIFEIQMEDQKQVDLSVFLINYAKQALRNSNNVTKSQNISHSISIVQNFIRNITNNSNIDFQSYINQNQIIDQSLIFLLNEIIFQVGLERATVQEKIKYLGNIFQLQMHQFDKGIKIQQSDTFLYIQSQTNIYLAFLALSQFAEGQITVEKSQQKMNNTQEKVVNSLQQRLNQPQMNSKKQSSVVQKFQIGSNQNDKIKENEQVLKNMIKNQKVQSIQSSIKNVRSDDSLQFTLGNKKENLYYKLPEKPQVSVKMLSSAYVKHAETVQQQNSNDSKPKNAQSVGQHRNIHKQQAYQHKMISMEAKYAINQDIFYKPEKKSNIFSPSNIKVGTNLDKNKRDPLDLCNQSEKGTFYRKFTDTRILNMLAQPYRSKVKVLKSRFIGVHSNNIRQRQHKEKQY